jgi:hypothetical protein
MLNIINQEQLNNLFPLDIHISSNNIHLGDFDSPFHHPIVYAIKDKLIDIKLDKNHVVSIGVRYIKITLYKVGSVYLQALIDEDPIKLDDIEEGQTVTLKQVNYEGY